MRDPNAANSASSEVAPLQEVVPPNDTLSAEERQKQLDQQLLQHQKLESIGHLAGGVAHDFNNMLTVILFNANAVLEQINRDHPFFEHLEEIRQAGMRSVDLTRQLLTFARKQKIAPRELQVNATIDAFLHIIERLVGESITVTWRPSADVWAVTMDPAQLHQIIANICLNSRDAIEGNGSIEITTRNQMLDADFCHAHGNSAAGEYVCICIRDTGKGMPPAVLSRVFEPFFSTKSTVESTGLGLSIVHGAVLQNGGITTIESVLEKGTTVNIYLPRCQAAETSDSMFAEVSKRHSVQHLTVLLVEDDDALLRTTTSMLKRIGHHVLPASNPQDAMALAELHGRNIDLLITDVVMPQEDGVELARSIKKKIPHLRILFMSGYTEDIITEHGMQEEGANFIAKPFGKPDLAKTLHKIFA